MMYIIAELSVLELVFEIGALASVAATGKQDENPFVFLNGYEFGLVKTAEEPGRAPGEQDGRYDGQIDERKGFSYSNLQKSKCRSLFQYKKFHPILR